ncbi:dTDP-4-dehydrorhamnose 3,5-epimerase family protein [Solwaraspora sp. WMMD406]|uniref:dTDP-4-dehydrorhamnose 3,5-epimerase family protein n=1 Tax=Solwaraspora sp. WMMD406 TaxID=3016095 RepID=UPI0024177D2F|nr:dTDP-4-dehydrorhamnose 3,5-epimerase family protein [Solwaraspora sp. WMMD406]MDG4766224.1 dTDP-4-dehydrorhamnose 3,5-epimerase family protein [Solwaraspora sp. WMMD406]
MKIRELDIAGAWEITGQQHGDPRGLFMEWYRFDQLAEAVGHPLRLAQGNLSVSAQGVVRGIHFADVPPGQAKYVSCVRGAVVDVIVDLRTGSPTFGRWTAVRLDDVDRRAVYLSEGLGHGFCSMTDDATLAYLCSTTYNPRGEHGIHPLDPDLAIDWPVDSPQLSARDDAAPTLAQALSDGTLPDYGRCQEFVARLDSGESPYPPLR